MVDFSVLLRARQSKEMSLEVILNFLAPFAWIQIQVDLLMSTIPLRRKIGRLTCSSIPMTYSWREMLKRVSLNNLSSRLLQRSCSSKTNLTLLKSSDLTLTPSKLVSMTMTFSYSASWRFTSLLSVVKSTLSKSTSLRSTMLSSTIAK